MTEHAAARMPRQIPFIIANEGCERFSFYGMRNILTISIKSTIGGLFELKSNVSRGVPPMDGQIC